MSVKEEQTQEVKLESPENSDGYDSDLEDATERDARLRKLLNLDLEEADKKVWLVRLPKFLADKWKDPKNLNGQELGKLRITQGPAGVNVKERPSPQVQIILNDAPENKDLPLRYDVNIHKRVVDNEYIFSERNLKEYKTEANEIASMPEQPELKPVETEIDPEPPRGFKRYRDESKSYVSYVKTIPKNTAIVGTVIHECQAIPVRNDRNYSKVVESRKNLRYVKPKSKVTLLDNLPGVIQSNITPNLMRNKNSTFLRSEKKDRRAEGRAIRMPQNQLLDVLFGLFDQYEYWTLKGLREKTSQPEAYLKEVLESVAELNKKGPYALRYSLKPEYKKLRDAERRARLLASGQAAPDKNDYDDDEEENVEMVEIA
ncbi:BA75_03956T0 [Komagataella pastoris]|uniref:Transcription initiation factor IIF subunit beta n=1 Tax=Komagataella pastoris TaxID=4922 RepID=A0A1B2JE83_PICPA|nr:BA75_03956T0 [Komagataella pastoris]